MDTHFLIQKACVDERHRDLRAAGLGSAPTSGRTRRYEHRLGSVVTRRRWSPAWRRVLRAADTA